MIALRDDQSRRSGKKVCQDDQASRTMKFGAIPMLVVRGGRIVAGNIPDSAQDIKPGTMVRIADYDVVTV